MALAHKRKHSLMTPDPTDDQLEDAKTDWSTFTPPAQLPISHPYLKRYGASSLLYPRPIAFNAVSTIVTGIYGHPAHPIAFSIGAGDFGHTNCFRSWCTGFISRHGADFRIAWIANSSRLCQVALLADIVQVSLTHEPEWEAVMEREGWGRVVRPALAGPEESRQCFWDHFVLAGPKDDPARLGREGSVEVREAFRRIAQGGKDVKWLSRGNGGATSNKEQQFWQDIGVDPSKLEHVEMQPLTAYDVLRKADELGAYLLSDRGNFLTAKRDSFIPGLVVYVEGGEDLLSPCAASVNTKVPDSVGQRLAIRFAEWLGEDAVQSYYSGYGRVWEPGYPLFTQRNRKDFADEEHLVGKDL